MKKIPFLQNPVNAPLLPLPDGCREGRYLRRVKRFSVELELDGKNVWAHCNDTGAMTGLLRPGAPVLVSPALNPARKLPWTMERIKIIRNAPSGDGSFWAGVNSSHPGKILRAAFHHGLLPFAREYAEIRMETVRGQSRMDALLTSSSRPNLWVECKNVTLVEDESACFPDAPGERARKHMRELMDIVRNGERGAMFYLVQRADGQCFRPADFIDKEYAELFYQAMDVGVEMYVFRARLENNGTNLGERLPVARS